VAQVKRDVKELLLRIRQGSEAEFTALAEQYAPLLDSMAGKYAASLGEDGKESVFPDFRQEAGLALYRASLTYDTEQTDVSFGLYAKICVRNALVSSLRSIKKERRTNGKAFARELHEEKIAVSRDPLARMIAREETAILREKMGSVLSRYEKRVFELYIAGKSIGEIAREEGKPVKSVNNAVYRIRTKLKGLLC